MNKPDKMPTIVTNISVMYNSNGPGNHTPLKGICTRSATTTSKAITCSAAKPMSTTSFDDRYVRNRKFTIRSRR